MENIVIVVHVLVALSIIGLILLQQGKGAEAGASFGGGASQTVFGSQGGGNFFAKVTAILAIIFFVTSFSLAIIAKNKAQVSTDSIGIPTLEQEGLESDVPAVNVEAENVASDVPVVVPKENSASDVPVAPAPEANQ